MSALPLPVGAFGMSIDIAKVKLLHDNVSCFDEKFIGMKQNTSSHIKTRHDITSYGMMGSFIKYHSVNIQQLKQFVYALFTQKPKTATYAEA